MFNSFTDDNYPDDYVLQEDDAFDVSDEDNPYVNLDEEVRKIRQAAFESCITSIEVEDGYTRFNDIWNRVQGIASKPWFKEAAIIAAILIFKTGLFMSYHEAHKANLKVPDL